MSDLISRQAAIDEIDAVCMKYDISPYFDDKRTDEEKRIDWWKMDKVLVKALICDLPSAQPERRWISVSERLPETDNENTMNKYNVLLWVANKTHPEREPQIYLGKLRQVKGDDGSGNFWGIKTEPCEWTIWGWSYFNEPEVIAWMPLPEPYKAESEEV